MKILLVDDSLTVRTYYGKLLSNYGHEVLTASTSEGALQIAQEKQPALAIIDFHLQGASGDELIYELHRNPRTMNIMVVMLSGDQDVLNPALEAGAIDLICKEEKPEIFLKRISAICRAISAQQNLSNQLVDLLQTITDKLNVGVALKDQRGIQPFNTTMGLLVEQYGELSQLAEGHCRECTDRIEVQNIPIEHGEQLILIREK